MPHPDYSALQPDDHYLVCLGAGVWLMDNHRWALKVWETVRERNQYTLVHADYHWDCCDDFDGSAERQMELTNATPQQVAQLVTEGELIRYDSFIAPAIRRGLIHTVHFYCLQIDSDHGLNPDLLATYAVKQSLHSSPESLASADINEPLLFDLCLDLYNRSDKWGVGDLWSDEEICVFLSKVRSLIQLADLVTISMSFNSSGAVCDTKHLAALVVPVVLSYRKD